MMAAIFGRHIGFYQCSIVLIISYHMLVCNNLYLDTLFVLLACLVAKI